MSDVKTLLRQHYEPVTPIDLERLYDQLSTGASSRARWRRPMFAVGAALLVLIVIGGVALLLPGGEPDFIDEQTTTTALPTDTATSLPTPASTAPTTQAAPLRQQRVLYESPIGSLDLGGIDVAPDGSLVVAVTEGTTAEGPPLPGAVRVGRCPDLECAEPPEFDGVAEYADTADVTVRSGPNGAPVIALSGFSFREPGGGASEITLQLATPEGLRALDTGIYTYDLELDRDGLPVLAYYRWQGSRGEVVLLSCGDETCSTDIDRTLVDLADGFSALDLEVRPDGSARLLYESFEPGQPSSVKMATCVETTCPSGPTITELPFTDFVRFASGPDGSPRLLLGRGAPEEQEGFELVVCDDPSCSSWTIAGIEHGRAVPEPGEDAYFDQIFDWADTFVWGAEWNLSADAQIMIDSAGHPVVAWLSGAQRGWIAICSDAQCSGYTVIDLGYLEGANHLDALLGSSGQPVVLYSSGYQIGLLDCVDRVCRSK